MKQDDYDISRTIDVNDVKQNTDEITDTITDAQGHHQEAVRESRVASPVSAANIYPSQQNQTLPPDSILQGSKYQIIKVLGKGGFGITYYGIQTGLNRPGAIKEFYMRDYCSRDDSSTVTYTRPDEMQKVMTFREKFLKEARMIADMSHENIVKIIDVFEENNTAYYIMEHINGGSL